MGHIVLLDYENCVFRKSSPALELCHHRQSRVSLARTLFDIVHLNRNAHQDWEPFGPKDS